MRGGWWEGADRTCTHAMPRTDGRREGVLLSIEFVSDVRLLLVVHALRAMWVLAIHKYGWVKTPALQ